MPHPESLQEAELQRQSLTLEIQDIQAQLGDKQRTNAQGRRLSAQEYWTWNRQAQHALTRKLNQLREVKAWLRAQRPVPGESDPPDLAKHLQQLCNILVTLSNEGVDLDIDELKALRAAQAALV